MASETGISFLNLDDRTVQIQLAQGTIEVHLRRYEPGNAVEIERPISLSRLPVPVSIESKPIPTAIRR